ncbi:MAG: hypothetical protein WC238_04945 [Parcubacteria group bacterium]|jgi:uncharacterized protein HemX
MTEEQSQPVVSQPAPEPQPVVAQPVVAQPVAPASAPAKKSNVWLWVIGGCLTILVLMGVAVLALGWWAAHKVKNAIKDNQPRLEQLQKDSEKWQKTADEMQEKADKWQKSLPDPEDIPISDDIDLQ